MNTSKYLPYLLNLFYLILFVSLICSFRAVSTIAIVVILVASMLKNKQAGGNYFINSKHLFIAGCCVFYLIQVASILYTHNLVEGFRYVRLQSALIFIPIALSCSNYLDAAICRKLMKHLIWILSAAMLYCFVIAIQNHYLEQARVDVFFYHSLVSPLNQNAVLVSILLFIGLVHLMEDVRKNVYPGNKYFHWLLIFYLIFCILMLSSKLVIIFLSLYLLYFFLILLIKRHSNSLIAIGSLAVVIIISSVLFTRNPISKRFNEITSGNISLIEQQKFTPANYFNGLQFRLLQWRFVSQILTEHRAWPMGVSGGDAQNLLNQKYISTNMYVGEPGTENGGFLGYDTHNQFLESVLQTGILGLFAFIVICYGMVRLAIERKSVELSSAVFLLIAYAFTESCFESQNDLIIFSFFPLFLYYGNKPFRLEPQRHGDKGLG